MKQINYNFIYDGSFYGLLNCYYLALKNDEMPMDIKLQNDSLLPTISVKTDENIAKSMIKGIKSRICYEAYEDLRVLYLSGDLFKEIVGLRFLFLAFKHGKSVMDMMSFKSVSVFIKLVRLVSNEARKFIEFLRFSECNGNLISIIEPENCILPIIAPHFTTRFKAFNLIIYDKTHSLALIYNEKQTKIITLDEFLEPQYNNDELKYRNLWKDFYNTIAIKERENPKLRQKFLPKKFQKNMTEFL